MHCTALIRPIMCIFRLLVDCIYDSKPSERLWEALCELLRIVGGLGAAIGQPIYWPYSDAARVLVFDWAEAVW